MHRKFSCWFPLNWCSITRMFTNRLVRNFWMCIVIVKYHFLIEWLLVMKNGFIKSILSEKKDLPGSAGFNDTPIIQADMDSSDYYQFLHLQFIFKVQSSIQNSFFEDNAFCELWSLQIFEEGFGKLPKHWHKIIELNGVYYPHQFWICITRF